MASIVLSYVGNQDPYSEKTNQEGSIITLIRYLLEQNQNIKKIVLLYTSGTQTNAEDTKQWINSELNIDLDLIDIIPVSQNFSDDPINLDLAIQEARNCLSNALAYRNKNDLIEFNSTSGTPAMKTAWGLLPALGYAPNSRLWQVRNPHEMKQGQSRVFANNVNIFKNESDLKVIKKQLRNYNYSGALESLNNSDFDCEIAKVLLKYGDFRLAFNFDNAVESIQPYQEQISLNLWQDTQKLKAKDQLNLLQEAYYKAITKLKNNEYADFIVLVISFQESLLKFLVTKKIAPNQLGKNWDRIKNEIKKEITTFEQNKLYKYLQAYLINGSKLRLDGELNRTYLTAIIEYFSDYSELIKSLKFLNNCADLRNQWVHNLEGVSQLANSSEILKQMREILTIIKPDFSQDNPFNLLNEQIVNHLNNSLRGQN